MHQLAELVLPQSCFSLSGKVTAKGGKLGPEDVECMVLVNWLREQTISGSFPFIWFKVPNEFDGRKNPVFGAKMDRLGRVKGAPDYVVLGKGKALLVEMKAAKGKMSSSQKLFKEWCDMVGVDYVVCKSGSDAIEILKGMRCGIGLHG